MPNCPPSSATPGAIGVCDLCRPRRRGRAARAARRRRPWLAEGVAITGRLGSPQTTALVEPRAFTDGLMRAAEAQGALLRHGTVVDVVCGASGAVRGVVLDGGEIVEGDAVVIAMGPWSILAARWLPLPAVFGYKGHSLVFETGDEHSRGSAVPRVPRGERRNPYARAVSARRRHDVGLRDLDAGPVPVDPADVAPDEGAHARLEAMCRNISPALAAAPIKARQACFRPVTADGLPLIGAVPGVAAPTWRPATASGACSMHRRPGRRWPS